MRYRKIHQVLRVLTQTPNILVNRYSYRFSVQNAYDGIHHRENILL